jgi:Fe-S cluster assembly iron-binding protein IscA
MLEITDVAVEQFKKVLSIPDANGSSIRIVVSGGCCFTGYGLDITEKGKRGDVLIEKGNLKIYVDPAVLAGLSEAALDYKNNLLMVSEQGRLVATGPLIHMKGGKP